MKKIVSLIFAAAAAFSCSTQSEGYKLQGTVKDLSGKVYLVTYEGKQSVRIDSLEVSDGTFTFDGVLDQVKLASVESADAGVVTTFFLGNNDVTLTGDMANPKETVVTGSAYQDEYLNYKSKYAGDLDLTLDYIKVSPTSPVAAYVLFREVSYKLPYQDIEKLIAGFDPQIQNSVYLKILGERVAAMKRSDVGQPYMDIALPDQNGNVVALSSILAEGKYVLVDFWASWCPPCRAENPHVVAAYEKYAKDGFTVYGVSLDKTKEAWVKGIEEDNLNWYNVSDLKFWNCEPAKQYGVSSIPSNYMISPDGKIVARNLRGAALEEFLAKTFAK